MDVRGSFLYQNLHNWFCNRLRKNIQTTKIRSVTVQGAECGLAFSCDRKFQIRRDQTHFRERPNSFSRVFSLVTTHLIFSQLLYENFGYLTQQYQLTICVSRRVIG